MSLLARRLILPLLLPLAAASCASADEVTQLRAEIAQLRADLTRVQAQLSASQQAENGDLTP